MPDLVDGAQARPIPKTVIQRAIEGARYVISGVTPQTWFGPSQPITPMAPAETAGRQFDYPFGFNLQYQPRSSEPIGFADLRALADNCDIIRLLIETRKDQLEAQEWDIRPRKLANGEHPKASEFATEIKFCKDFFAYPDKEHDFDQWARMLGEDMFVIDAATLYVHPDRGGKIYSFDVVDGATLKPLIDGQGRRPLSSDPAYQQILHGVPASDYSTDQLIYYVRNPRSNRVYGYSPVEQTVMTMNMILRRQMHQLSYYTEGNLTDAFFTAPSGWTKDQVADWQKYWDSLFAGNLAARRRGTWVPNGMDIKQPKAPILKDPFDELLLRIASFAFNVSPQWAVSQMNRATADTQKKQAEEQGLVPVLNWYRRLMNNCLTRLGYSQLEFIWDEDREVDPETGSKIDQGDTDKGIRTRNEVRVSRGLAPSTNPVADMLTVTTASGVMPIDGSPLPNAPEPVQVIPPGAEPGAEPAKGGEQTTDEPTAPKPGKNPEAGRVGKRKTKVTRRVDPPSLDRPVARAARKVIAGRVAKGLAAARKSVTKELRKVEKADEDPRTKALLAVDEFDLSDISDTITGSVDDFAAVAADGGKLAAIQLGFEGDDDMFGAINSRAVKWADKRSAKLVTDIDKSTRDQLRGIIAKGLDDGLTMDDIADLIEESNPDVFSEDRAELIASTEIGNANSEGALAGYKEAEKAGVAVKKVWLLGDDACDACQENADAGPIDLEDEFPSGDDAPLAHPHCECAIAAEVEEDETD